MKFFRFLNFRLLFTVGMVIVVLNSWGQGGAKVKKDPLTFDEGVIINGVKWATRNVAAPGTFAANPEDVGMYYQWNREIAWASNGDDETGWDNTVPDGATWEKDNDPSPAGWHVPTFGDFKKLLDINKVSSEWTTINGITGRRFTDEASGKSVFLPATGYRYRTDGKLNNAGLDGNYWSSVQFNGGSAYSLYFCGDYEDMESSYRKYGFSVRCVAE